MSRIDELEKKVKELREYASILKKLNTVKMNQITRNNKLIAKLIESNHFKDKQIEQLKKELKKYEWKYRSNN